jgi:hypothetical protein
MTGRRPPASKRPFPPSAVLEGQFAPAPDVLAWLHAEILAEDGALHNPEHQHLLDADLAVLWAPGPAEKQGRSVIGTAEEVAFRCSAWQRERQEQQMREWFGHVPDYLITLAGSYCATCSDAEFAALVEHELYHVAQRRDLFDQPVFTKDGQPKLFIRGHDVEEFVGVVRRYGVGDPNGALARLAAAARGTPEVSRVAIAGACGTCLLKAA